MSRKWRIAFVVPRFNVKRAGGAEILVEALSVQLAKKGHEVRVLTTCAQDHSKWQNELKPGNEDYQGVQVCRFEVDPRKDIRMFSQLQGRIERRWILNTQEELRWIQGSVHSQALYEWIKSHEQEWDVLIFTPYLFGLTYGGSQIAPHKSLLIPCLHPESYAQLKVFQTMFQRVQGIMFNSNPEKDLGKSLFSLEEKKCSVVGMGFELQEEKLGSPDQFRKKHHLGNSPILLYAGRKEKGKGVDQLAQYFHAFKKNTTHDVKLVIIGSGELDFSHSPDVHDLGYVSSEDKRSAYQAASVVCQPSINESFSIVLMESWLMRTPVLVNAYCAVTFDHVSQSGGGLYYKDFYEFNEAIEFLLGNKELCQILGKRGFDYTVQNYNWGNVLKKFEDALEKFL